MTDQEKIAKLRNALLVLLDDLEYDKSNRAFLSPVQPVSALVNPLTLAVVDEALDATVPLADGPLKEGSVKKAHGEQHGE